LAALRHLLQDWQRLFKPGSGHSCLASIPECLTEAHEAIGDARAISECLVQAECLLQIVLRPSEFVAALLPPYAAAKLHKIAGDRALIGRDTAAVNVQRLQQQRLRFTKALPSAQV